MANNGNIYLIGMMGSGKTVTGRVLAEYLERDFVDLDAEIQTTEGRSIPEIFEKSGEPYFRDVESSVLERISKRGGQVVAAGGGIVLREQNVQLMKKTGKVVLLKASAEALWQRVRFSKDRPLLNRPDPLGALRQILSDRESYYENACDLFVLTDHRSAEDVAHEIREVLKKK